MPCLFGIVRSPILSTNTRIGTTYRADTEENDELRFPRLAGRRGDRAHLDFRGNVGA